MSRISNLGQALDQVERLRVQQAQLDRLSLQMTSGKKTDKFSDLGSDALVTKRARASTGSIDAFRSNITNADRRIQLMSLSVREFRAQSESWSAFLVGFAQQDVHQQGDIVYYDNPLTVDTVEQIPVGMDTADPDVAFTSLQDMAANLYDVMTELLNTQDDTGRYLFGGAETQEQPVSESTGLIDAAISSMIVDWKDGTMTNDEFIANLQDRVTTGGNTDALTDSILGYSSALSAGNAGNVFVRADDGVDLDYTVHANEQVFRDIMVGLAFLKNENLPPIADVYLEGDPAYPAPPSTQGAPGATLDEMKDNFFAVYNAVVQMVGDALQNMENQEFKLENVRARIDQIDKRHEATKNLLLTTVSDIEDVDINAVAVRLSAVQVQIESSYAVTALIGNLSIVNFL